MSLTARLQKLSIELPPVSAPVAAYIPAMVVGKSVRTSGQLPFFDGELLSTGTAKSVPEAAKAARQAALNALAAAAAAAGGIDKIASVTKVTGFVSSAPDFFDQPAVVNGASELFQEIFGSPHIRSAVGVSALPLNATVEIEVEFALN